MEIHDRLERRAAELRGDVLLAIIGRDEIERRDLGAAWMRRSPERFEIGWRTSIPVAPRPKQERFGHMDQRGVYWRLHDN